jgi:hypothetical protein
MKQEEALDILKTGVSVFLTGEPGSGKSYVAARYVATLRREGIPVSVTASTGIAAAQLGGTTIHAWSGIGTRSQVGPRDLEAISKNRRIADRMKKTRVLIIDEVSMLSGQTLSAVSQACQYVRQSRLPFGGLQTIFVGDFFQLPPVVRRDDRFAAEMDSQDPEDLSPFAYAARAWRDLEPAVCYLTEQHRQSDDDFSGLLSAIRSNRVGKSDLALLASRRTSGDSLPHGITRVFTHNTDVDRINDAELAKIPGEARSFFMSSTGDKVLADGLKRGCLSPERLDLKKGAIVMFTKNDPEGRYVNGTLGFVTGFDTADGAPVVQTKMGPVTARAAEWKVAEDETVKAGITQIPLRLAWAITVHKSQGMSLDAALMDLSNAFEYGQGYVALSRVRTLTGLYLLGWNDRALRVHPEALAKDAEFRQASEIECERLARSRESLTRQQREFLQNAGGAAATITSPQTAQNPQSASAPARAGEKWSASEDAELAERYKRGESVKAIAAAFSRQEGGVRSRLAKLGLIIKA